MEDQATVTATTATAAFNDDNDTLTRVAMNTSTADVDTSGAVDAETDMTLTSTSGDPTEEEMRREVNSRLSHLVADFQRSVTNAMTSLTERYHSEKRAHIATEQTAVLRVNKVMRDLARSLGPLWRQVYRGLADSFMASPIGFSVSQAAVGAELSEIDREAGHYRQTYRCLQYWRRACEAELGDKQGQLTFIDFLIGVLRTNQRPELAASVQRTMQSTGDVLLSVALQPQAESSAIQNGSTDSKGQGQGSDPSEDHADASEYPSDAQLLQLAKQVKDTWATVAMELGLSAESVSEIGREEGGGHRAAFKALWTWRDARSSTCTVKLATDQLIQALQRATRADLVDLVARWKP